MSVIFLSHSSADAALAAQLQRRLNALDFDVFLDFDTRNGLELGRPWKRQLYTELKRCDALLILWSKPSAASRWCTAEITFADASGKPVFALALDQTALDPVLLERQVGTLPIHATDAEIGALVDRLCKGFEAAGIDAGPVSTALRNRQPYPGLKAFEADDESLYFGRSTEIAAGLQALLRHRSHEHAQGLMAITGASGVGKSSLLRAGLLPRLRRDAGRWTVVGPIRPAREPFTNLAAALSQVLTTALGQASMAAMAATDTAQRLAQALDAAARTADAGGPADGVANLVLAMVGELRRVKGHDDSTAVIAIDQLEELFDPRHAAVRSAFLAVLSQVHQAAAGVNGSAREVMLLATLRTEYLNALSTDPGMQAIQVQPLPLLPISLAGLRDAISRPAMRFAGVEVAPDLVETIVADAGSRLALPLVGFTLEQLWDANPGLQTLRLEDYHRMGGVQGSVADVADRVIKAYGASGWPQRAVRSAFLMMVRIDDDGPTGLARRSADWQLIDDSAKPVLEAFANKRLLVIDQSAAGLNAGRKTVEVAHEALFTAWQPLREWLASARSELKLLHQLEIDARDGWIDVDSPQAGPGRFEDGMLSRWQGQRLIDAISAATALGAAGRIRDFIAQAWSAENQRLRQETGRLADRLLRLQYETELVEFDDSLDQTARETAYLDIDHEKQALALRRAALDELQRVLVQQRHALAQWRIERRRAARAGLVSGESR